MHTTIRFSSNTAGAEAAPSNNVCTYEDVSTRVVASCSPYHGKTPASLHRPRHLIDAPNSLSPPGLYLPSSLATPTPHAPRLTHYAEQITNHDKRGQTTARGHSDSQSSGVPETAPPQAIDKE